MTRSGRIIADLEAWLGSEAPSSWGEAGFLTASGMPLHRDIQQHLDELSTYLDVLQQVEPREISIEIGLYRGGTHFAWRQLFSEVVSIDSDYWACCKAMLEFPGTGSKVIYGDSPSPETIAVLQTVLALRPADHLFIDGNHDANSVRADFLAYSPLVRKDGVIGFHDSHLSWGGVSTFLSDLARGDVPGWPPTPIHDINYYSGEYATGISYVYKTPESP
jgi:cephalosporin hydroxylase